MRSRAPVGAPRAAVSPARDDSDDHSLESNVPSVTHDDETRRYSQITGEHPLHRDPDPAPATPEPAPPRARRAPLVAIAFALALGAGAPLLFLTDPGRELLHRIIEIVTLIFN
jgi:hypothetical protein